MFVRLERKRLRDPKAPFTIHKLNGCTFPSHTVSQTIRGTIPYATTRVSAAGIAIALQSAYEIHKLRKGELDEVNSAQAHQLQMR
jgi:hypothetical protein